MTKQLAASFYDMEHRHFKSKNVTQKGKLTTKKYAYRISMLLNV